MSSLALLLLQALFTLLFLCSRVSGDSYRHPGCFVSTLTSYENGFSEAYIYLCGHSLF
jgi:hypothetical protein